MHDQNHIAPFLLLDGTLGQCNRAGSHGPGNARVTKSHFYTHFGQDARVELDEAHAHFDGRFLPIGSRNDRDDFAGDFPVGVGIQRSFDRLAGLNAIDVTLIDIDFNFQRSHVHNRADAGASKTAAGGDRRNHFAWLSVLRSHDAGKWSTNHVVLHLLLPGGDLALRHDHVRALLLQFGLKRKGRSFSMIQVSLCGDFVFQQI